MRVLNQVLTTEGSVAVQVPFAPVSLPCNDTLLWGEDGNRFVYGAVVFVTDSREWAIYEFHQPIMDALEAYRFRHGGIQNLEFCLSRFEDQELRIGLGRSNMQPVASQVKADDYKKYADLAARLNSRYEKLSRSGPVQILL